MRGVSKYVLTTIVVLMAVGVTLWRYWHYVVNPWTRDGQVRAQVIKITPRVSAPIIKLPIKDNQLVKVGDLLFEMDPRTFKAALAQARGELNETKDKIDALEKQVEAAQAEVEVAKAALDQAKAGVSEAGSEIEKSKSEYDRQKQMLRQGATSKRMVERAKATYEVDLQKKVEAEAAVSEAKSQIAQAEAMLAEAKANLGAAGDANARLQTAKAAEERAALNLEFTQVKAPVAGYVTNLNLRIGSQGVANEPALALVDINSYWIVGYFRETYIGNIEAGDRAVVTLMAYPNTPLEGVVDSVGWGIAQEDGRTGEDLLPHIEPTFEWIRLAQRVPVRVHLTNVPDKVKLVVGTTASVLVMHGEQGGEGSRAQAAPRALQ